MERQSKSYSWRASSEMHGSPGAAGSGPIGVLINEIIARTQAPIELSDSIELYNSSESDIDIGGWYLSDSANNLLKFQIPVETTLGAGQYIVFDESDFNASGNPGPGSFALDGDQGEDVWLVAADAQGNVTRFVDDVHFRTTKNGTSLARIPNGGRRLTPAVSNTFGAENLNPRVGPVVISELHYNPGAPSTSALTIDATLTSDDLEFLEIHNPTDEAIDLTGWRVRGGVDYDFDAFTSLLPCQSLVVISFNPDNPANSRRLAGFKAHYGIQDGVDLVGGYRGRLRNSEDNIRLLRAEPSPSGQANFIARVQEDEVLYDDLTPWPIDANGTGASLTRTALDGLGNDATNWFSAAPSPGSLLVRVPGDANNDGVFDQQDIESVIVANKYLSGQPTSFREGDWNGDGLFNQLDIVAALQHGSYQQDAVAALRPHERIRAVDDLFARTVPR